MRNLLFLYYSIGFYVAKFENYEFGGLNNWGNRFLKVRKLLKTICGSKGEILEKLGILEELS